jgi:hypothetical protein
MAVVIVIELGQIIYIDDVNPVIANHDGLYHLRILD